jgi:hypothetical protein
MTDVYSAGSTTDAPVPKPASDPVPVADTAENKTAGTRRPTRADIKELVTTILERTGEKPGKAVGGAYYVRPDGRFIDEEDDEEVVLMLRSHPITNLGWIISLTFIVLMMEIFLGTGVLGNVPGKYILVGRLIIYLIALGYAFQKFLDWYYSVLIITNERVINVDFINLLYRVVSYATLNHIEEPSMVAGGFIRSFFRYGDIYIETAAEIPTIEAKAIPYPDRVIRIISELSEELEKMREYGQ